MHVCRDCIFSAHLAAEKTDMCVRFHLFQASGKATASKHVPGVTHKHTSLCLCRAHVVMSYVGWDLDNIVLGLSFA